MIGKWINMIRRLRDEEKIEYILIGIGIGIMIGYFLGIMFVGMYNG